MQKVHLKYFNSVSTHMSFNVFWCQENALGVHVESFSVRLHNNTKGSHLLHPGPWVSNEA